MTGSDYAQKNGCLVMGESMHRVGEQVEPAPGEHNSKVSRHIRDIIALFRLAMGRDFCIPDPLEYFLPTITATNATYVFAKMITRIIYSLFSGNARYYSKPKSNVGQLLASFSRRSSVLHVHHLFLKGKLEGALLSECRSSL